MHIEQQAIMLFSFFQVVRCLRLLKKFDPNEFQLKSTASNYKFGKKRSGYQSSSGTSIRELYIWYDQCRRDKRYNTCWGTSRKPYIGATLWYYMFLIDDILHSLAYIGASIFIVIAIVFRL